MAAQKKLKAPVDLGHPIYLDIEMLLTFLAAIEDGVAHSSEVAVKFAESRSQSGEVSGGVKIPSLASLLGLSLSVNGKLNRGSKDDETVESKMVRQHTSASLFNRLRNHLREEGAITYLQKASDLDDVEPGTLVEMTGICEENPILRAVDALRKLLPFAELELESLREQAPKLSNAERKKLAPTEIQKYEGVLQLIESKAKENAKSLKIAEMVENDLRSSPIVDLVMSTAGFSAIVSAGREYFTDELVAGLKDGTYKLIGKVNHVNTDDDADIPVTRRGGMGLVANVIDSMVDQIRDAATEGTFQLDLPKSRLTGRYIQVVPLAIYI